MPTIRSEDCSLTIALMAFAGCIVGFALDTVIARLAREPYEYVAEEDEEQDAGTGFDLASETGSLELPALLDSKSWHRRVAVVLVTAGAFALVGWRYDGDSLHLAIVSSYVCALIICSATDLLAYRVPNVITYPFIIAAFAVGMTLSSADRLDVVFGGLLFGGLLFVPSLLSGGAMGMGDVKLALFVGFALGLTFVVPAMILMALGGGAAAIFLLVSRVRGRRDPIPYAPFIAAGAFVVMITQGTAFAEL
jgi:prepilin signal peptidase PulO-like enzyme (type II secretory pathway)